MRPLPRSHDAFAYMSGHKYIERNLYMHLVKVFPLFGYGSGRRRVLTWQASGEEVEVVEGLSAEGTFGWSLHLSRLVFFSFTMSMCARVCVWVYGCICVCVWRYLHGGVRVCAVWPRWECKTKTQKWASEINKKDNSGKKGRDLEGNARGFLGLPISVCVCGCLLLCMDLTTFAIL